MTTLREARTLGEQLAAVLVIAIKRYGKENKPLDFAELLALVRPYIELTEVRARLIDVMAGKVIGQALREKSMMELEAQQTKVLFEIAEIIRKLELP